MRAISVFSLEAGTSTLGWRAWIAFRTRVSMSAMGSLVIVLLLLCPGFPRPCGASGLSHVYQLALVTPGISPLRASWRKHSRQIPNLRRKARGLPHRQQRLRCRVGCLSMPGLFAAFAVTDARRILSSFRSFAIFAVVAIDVSLYWRNG